MPKIFLWIFTGHNARMDLGCVHSVVVMSREEELRLVRLADTLLRKAKFDKLGNRFIKGKPQRRKSIKPLYTPMGNGSR